MREVDLYKTKVEKVMVGDFDDYVSFHNYSPTPVYEHRFGGANEMILDVPIDVEKTDCTIRKFCFPKAADKRLHKPPGWEEEYEERYVAISPDLEEILQIEYDHIRTLETKCEILEKQKNEYRNKCEAFILSTLWQRVKWVFSGLPNE